EDLVLLGRPAGLLRADRRRAEHLSTPLDRPVRTLRPVLSESGHGLGRMVGRVRRANELVIGRRPGRVVRAAPPAALEGPALAAELRRADRAAVRLVAALAEQVGGLAGVAHLLLALDAVGALRAAAQPPVTRHRRPPPLRARRGPRRLRARRASRRSSGAP